MSGDNEFLNNGEKAAFVRGCGRSGSHGKLAGNGGRSDGDRGHHLAADRPL
ncbi:msl4551 [Mesorhizobium japonicum MAFF 303099]|uniref:Msl4551 protein n=1 Tax=Mesorhizobium japonicum (strain LMG 29417 / CECT 9101 / MAFF 303099) TaxID=266835 RepID=Q98DU0_RHILO|nr:msl4551 [Mesorhizobium japonicum MAFF 303099]